MCSPAKPLTMRITESQQDSFASAPIPPQFAAPFFQPPMLPAPFLPAQSLADAISTGPQLPITLERALEVVAAAVTSNLGADSSFYWTFDEFRKSLIALVAARRDERAKDIAEKIAAAIEEGRTVRADTERLEGEHNRLMMEWNTREGVASQARVQLNAILANDPAQHDEFVTEAERQAWAGTVAPAEARAGAAAKAAGDALQNLHLTEEKITRRKADLETVRARLRGLREEL